VDYATGLQAVDKLRNMVPQGMSMTQFALRWIMMFDAVTCAIPGAKTPAQVQENAAAASFPALPADTMLKIKELYDGDIKPLVHHYW
jgi:aryl-alcohol dehydrogenase-like predicted oxidoreductase